MGLWCFYMTVQKCSWTLLYVCAYHIRLFCYQILVHVKDQMITELVAFLVPYFLFVVSYNKQPSVMMTSVWLQPRANQLPPRPPLCCFMELSEGLQFSKKWFTAAQHTLKFLSVFLLTCVDCLRRRGILEGWRSARGLVAMVTNPWAGFHLAGRKLNYLQTEMRKLM